MRQLLVTANLVPSSPIRATLMMAALRSPETSVLTRVTRRNIPKDSILHGHRRENLKSCRGKFLDHFYYNFSKSNSASLALAVHLHMTPIFYRPAVSNSRTTEARSLD
jgi:hypothetical protein